MILGGVPHSVAQVAALRQPVPVLVPGAERARPAAEIVPQTVHRITATNCGSTGVVRLYLDPPRGPLRAGNCHHVPFYRGRRKGRN